jgi:hypothetical protein
MAKIGEVITRYWSIHDSPIPKKNEILETMFNEKFKVLSRARSGDEVVIKMQRV